MSKLVVALLVLWSVAVCRRLTCPRGWWQDRPGFCQRDTPPREHQTPRGGWTDDSPPGDEVGAPLHCTGGATLRQRDGSAWCQR